METIKVNMTPCEDVQTIHASQNDNEAREWGFELHNNGEKIDSSSISDQLVFKAYEGGTEEILPTNGSTPTTSPIIADIKYPQGLLTDQEFTYRQSPTEEDGLAKITDIKGNTLVWNQLVQNGNFESTSGWSINSGGTLSSANNEASVTVTSVPSNTYSPNIRQTTASGFVLNHKYLFSLDVYLPHQSYMRVEFGGGGFGRTTDSQLSANAWHKVLMVITRDTAPANNLLVFYPPYATGVWSANDVWKIRNVNVFDLTQMGLDISNPSEFASLFPLSYYAYNQGTLLSFNGNGIKTVGKNQVANVVRGYFSVGASAISVDNDSESFVFYAIKGKTYVSSSAVTLNRNAIARCDTPNLVNGSPIYDIVNTSRTWTATWTGWAVWYVYSSKNEVVENSAQVEFGTTPTSYEPYTSSTLSLPISTYFSNGMKSAGSVYDELTETKAITRVGMVDLGTLNWTIGNAQYNIFQADLSSMKPNSNWVNNINFISSIYHPSPKGSNEMDNLGIRQVANNANTIWIRNTSYTDATTFKNAMSGVYLYYELATPTETSFSTASLVTENAEIPLSNNDGVLVGKCIEQLSAEPGFHDAKIKLSDNDGTCYSNKIQLHVERKPS